PRHHLVLERTTGWELHPSSAIRLLSDPMVLRGTSAEMLFGLLRLSMSAIDKARKVKIPTLTMVGSKDEVLRTACIRQLHKSLKGGKTWAEFEDGPHLLLHWKERAKVLDRMVSWIDARLLADKISALRHRRRSGHHIPGDEQRRDQRARQMRIGAAVGEDR